MSIHRIHEVIEPTLPVPDTARAKTPRDTSVQFEQVDFRYTEGGPLVLRKVSFNAPQSGVTALVGPSGAGKTTVARLIPRFWDVSAGCIRIGGVDVRDMLSETLMRQVAFVFQDAFLFADRSGQHPPGNAQNVDGRDDRRGQGGPGARLHHGAAERL